MNENKQPTAFQFIPIPVTATFQTFTVPFEFDYMTVWAATGKVTVRIDSKAKNVPDLPTPVGFELIELCPGQIQIRSTVAEIVTMFFSRGGVRIVNPQPQGASPLFPVLQVGGFILEGNSVPFSQNMPVFVGMREWYDLKIFDMQTVNAPVRGWGSDSGGTRSPQNLAAAPADGYNLVHGLAAGAGENQIFCFGAKRVHVEVVGIVGASSLTITGNLRNGGLDETVMVYDKAGTLVSNVGLISVDGIYTIYTEPYYQINNQAAGPDALEIGLKFSY